MKRHLGAERNSRPGSRRASCPRHREHRARISHIRCAVALSEDPSGRAGQSSVAVGGACSCHALSKWPVHRARGGTSPPACGTCGWAGDPGPAAGTRGARQGSTTQPGLASARTSIGCDVGTSLRRCVHRWGPWPVTERALAVGSSPVRGGSPRGFCQSPLKQNRVPRAWLAGRSACTRAWVCAAPRAGGLRS